MSTYSLSGSGTHALTSNTTGLQVTITTSSSIGGSGRSNPVAKYDQGLLRFSDGTAYWPPVAILGGPQFIPVPANASSIGYALLGGAVVSVTEVIGGTLFFSAGTPSLESLADVLVSAIADGQSIKWNASAGKWENYTPATPGPGGAIASASVHSSVTQPLTNGATVLLTYDTADWDTDTMWTAGTPNRLTVHTAGKYLVLGSVGFDTNGSGTRELDIFKNGVIAEAASHPPDQFSSNLQVMHVDNASVSDYYQLKATQNSGTTLNTYDALTRLRAVLIG